MVSVILYIATSLDGYIARKDGGVDWLSNFDSDDEDYGYSAFYDSIDALVMGSRTYEQALGFGDWPYQGKQTYVLSRRGIRTQRKDITIAPHGPDDVLREIESRGYEWVWLVGGSQLTAAFRAEGLIDEYIISIIPIILGGGLPLFVSPATEEKLELLESKQYSSGLVQVHYKRITEA